jgi:hypothetical protein
MKCFDKTYFRKIWKNACEFHLGLESCHKIFLSHSFDVTDDLIEH